MNKRIIVHSPISGLQSGSDLFGLIICGALFICGGIAGTAAAGLAEGSGVSDFLADFLPLKGNMPSLNFVSVLFGVCKYHLAAIFFGFSILGVLCLPVLSAVRGFFLCFTISAIVRHFGGDGVFLAFVVSGISALFTVPCFFVLSVQSFSASLRLLQCAVSKGFKGAAAPFGVSFFRRIAVCFIVLTCSALIDTLLLPGLVAKIAAELL